MAGWTDDKRNSMLVSSALAAPAYAVVGTTANLMTGCVSFSDNGLNTTDIGLTHRLSYDWSLQTKTASTAELCLIYSEWAFFIANFRHDFFTIDPLGAMVSFRANRGYHAKGIDSERIYQ